VDFYAILDQVIDLLRQRQRVTYRALQRQFGFDDAYLEDLKAELIDAQRLATDEEGKVLVWTGDTGTTAPAPPPSTPTQERTPLTYTPSYLAEKILASRGALEGERKQVTVLFADLKGSTELIEGLDPEEARALLDPALHVMMDAVHRYEGTVNQVLGDGIMALFGAPVAHEDHAVRACYAALAMQTAMRRHTAEVRQSHGLEMQMRVGLHSGEVVVRAIGNDLHMDYSAVGQTTHLAARMEQLATPGSIRLTVATLRLAEGLVQVNALGRFPVKGLAEPVEVFELVGASAIRRRLQASAARGLTPFVGRQQELTALQQALAQAGTGHGQVAALVGEAGVGKSRLVYEFVHSHHTQGWSILESASVSYGKATPYFPVIDLLKRYVRLEDHDDARTIRAKVTGQVLTLDEGLLEIIPALLGLLDALPEDSPFLHLDPPQRRQQTLAALNRLLLRESQEQRLLLVVEDLHWIDSETQVLLDSLVERLSTAPLLLLVNYRPEYQHGWGSKTYYMQLPLDPLPPASAAAVLQVLLGDDSSLAPLTQLLIARTEGNPFFLEESVRTLVETRVLVGEPGAYCLAQTLPTIQMPATVQAVLAARIDRLLPEDKHLLQTAAVIGHDVPLLLLQAIAELPEEALRHGLARLQAADFLYATRIFPDFAYTFKHALTHEVAYNSPLLERRRRLHERTAQAIEALFHDGLEEHYSELAHHYSRSGNATKAVTYCQRAGQQAVQRSANLEAIRHFTNGLEVLKTLPETLARAQQELALQIALGVPLIATRGYGASEVEGAYTRARELCQQVGDTPQLFLVLRGRWNGYLIRAELQMARELGEQLLQLAQREQDPALLIEAHRALGTTLFFLGELVPGRGHLEQGIGLYDPQQHRSLAFRYGADPGVICGLYVANVLWLLGYPDQALARIHEALTLAHELAHAFSLAFALNHTANLYQFRREGQATQERAEASIAFSTEQRFAQWLAQGMILRGWALAEQGQEAEGIAQLRQGLAAWQATGAELDRPRFLALLAEAYGKAGLTEEGLRLLVEAQAAVRRSGERRWEAELYRLKGELLLARSSENHAEAEACFREAFDIASHQGAKLWELRAAMSLARLWQQQGKRAEARALLAPVYGWFTEGFDTADLQEARALLEALA
jgi:class 3 adenylate cyclase/predicted ATPase